MRPPTAADPYPFAGTQLPCLVGGEFIRTRNAFQNLSPVDGTTLCTVSEADAALVDRAVQAARSALQGPWGRASLPERCALLRKVAERIEARFAEFVSAEVADTGKTLKEASTLDIPRGAANFRAYADLALARSAECFEMATPDGRGALNYAVHKPVGVVAVVAPWNLPFLLLTWKVAPALVCGNTVVAKPSEETPATAALLAEVMQEAGIPPGVFNLVHGFGPGSAGEALVSHPEVDAIAFTGESATGAAIMRSAARLGEGAVVRARRQERCAGVRRCGFRGGRERYGALGILQLRPGVPVLGARVRRAADLRALRRGAGRARTGAEDRRPRSRARTWGR